MKKIFSFIILFFVVISSTNAYVYSYNTYNTCNTKKELNSYDYYFDSNYVKKYSFDKNSRKIDKFCVYKDNGKTEVLKNGETKVLEETYNNIEKYKKILCDNGALKTIFKWEKIIKMSCVFSVNNHKYVIKDGESKIVTNKYYNTTISQKFVCNNGKIKKVDEWLGKKTEKKVCYFEYNNKVYKLEHGAYTTLKNTYNYHTSYHKFVCNNGEVKEYSTWRDLTNNNHQEEFTKNCRFVYRGKYYDLQNNGLKEFTTTIYTNGVKKVFNRKYYCNNGLVKIFK